jgi:hypothetical protein
MAEASEGGQDSRRAVEPMMMMMMILTLYLRIIKETSATRQAYGGCSRSVSYGTSRYMILRRRNYQ